MIFYAYVDYDNTCICMPLRAILDELAEFSSERGQKLYVNCEMGELLEIFLLFVLWIIYFRLCSAATNYRSS